MRRMILLTATVCFIVFASFGCEKNEAVRIAGKVTIDGVPLEKGEVRFLAVDGKTQATGGLIQSGEYEVHTPLGPKNVQISGYVEVGKKPLYLDMPNSPTLPIVKPIAEQTVKYDVTQAAEKDFELGTANLPR